ncbi:PorT family protein [Muribaculaceae bacterium Isolate-002 (NCI)]|nr:PorT family protein [Muribaculaceae bacterium Isolate-002 (NCI)]
MKRVNHILLALAAIIAVISGSGEVCAQHLNDKLLNRPYADMRRWHLGFSVGLHTQDLRFTHNGFITPEGESWFIEQPSFQPGFNVNGLFDLRLNDYFNVRFTPGLYFGNRDLRFREVNTGEELKQSLKSAYLAFPVDLKFSALRLRNLRPYVTAGIMPAVNLTRKNGEYIKLNSSDFYLTCGFGCDLYLPYFKLIPEVKFCFGLVDVVDHKRPDLTDDPAKQKFTQSLKKAASSMVVFSFYFE